MNEPALLGPSQQAITETSDPKYERDDQFTPISRHVHHAFTWRSDIERMPRPSRSAPHALMVLLSLLATLLVGCGESPPVWLEQQLPSGRQVKVFFMMLAWGVEHDERFPDQDAFTLWYVTTLPEGGQREREMEAREVFELIRPISEQWGFKSATLAAYRTPRRERSYDLFIFARGSGGEWLCTPSDVGHPR